MQTQLYIGGYCVISNGSIIHNGIEIFADTFNDSAADFLTSAYKALLLNYPKFYKMDNLSKLGWLCAETLLQAETQATGATAINIPETEKDAVCVVLCNASSSLDTDLRYYETVSKMPSPALFVYTLPNIVIGEICIRNGWKGENAFFVRDAFDADFLHEQVRYMLDDNHNKYCLCGWVELLGNNYKAALLLVDKTNARQKAIFTPAGIWEVINNIPARLAIAAT